MLLIALLIKLTSKGPILYKSLRVKQGFIHFDCYKFRTMHVDADDRLKRLLSKDLQLKTEWKRYQKLKKDPRVTPLGRFLRKSSLDELPQLFNVLKDDMSLVGPRPYAIFGTKKGYKKELYSLYGKEIEAILTVKPGLTGLWQVSGRNLLPTSERVRLDLKYVELQSLELDLRLLIKTIPEVLFSKGAF
jgi:undecaprenyl-phosphate galactose phosphotransferase